MKRGIGMHVWTWALKVGFGLAFLSGVSHAQRSCPARLAGTLTGIGSAVAGESLSTIPLPRSLRVEARVSETVGLHPCSYRVTLGRGRRAARRTAWLDNVGRGNRWELVIGEDDDSASIIWVIHVMAPGEAGPEGSQTLSFGPTQARAILRVNWQEYRLQAESYAIARVAD